MGPNEEGLSTREADVLRRAAAGDPVALAQQMVRIPSVNPSMEADGTGEAALARQAHAWLSAWGFRSELQEVAPGRWNVVASRGEGGRRLVLNGHLDTVGVKGMEISPFSGELKEGRIWGRGACDMKGGLAIILATAATLAREAHPGELVVALTADEEHASIGMEAFAGTIAGADGAVVCEPTSLAVMPAHKGFLWVEAEFKGRAAHGSRPEEGVDAILHAGRFLAALEGMSDRLSRGTPHPILSFPSLHAGTIEGGSVPSVYPASCRLVVERRTLPGEDPAAIMADFQDLLDEVAAEVPGMDARLTPGLFRPGTEVAASSSLVRDLLAAIETEGVAGRVGPMTAWVDAAFLNEAGIPAVCFGPGSIADAHAAVEWVPVGEVEAGARILTRFAGGFLKGS
jgi:acetylornithine deacetylase